MILRHRVAGARRRSALPLAVGLLAVGLYLPWTGGEFVADDWSVLARHGTFDPGEIPGWFLHPHTNWYRPLFELYAAVNVLLLGVYAPSHRWVGLAIYGLTTILVGGLAEALTGSRRLGRLAALCFALLAVHPEAVLWLASANELLAGLFGVLCLWAYARYRSTGRRSSLALSVVAFGLAVGAKETALGLPIALAAIHHMPPVSDGIAAAQVPGDPDASSLARSPTQTIRRLPPWILFGALSAILIWVRLGRGLPYTVSLAPAQLARNAIYYVGMVFLGLPPALEQLIGPAGHGPTLVPWIAVMACAIGLIGLVAIVGAAVWRRRAFRPTGGVAIAAVILLAGMVPTLPIVAQRTAYMASVGGAILLGYLVLAAWSSVEGSRVAAVVVATLAGVVAIATVLLLAGLVPTLPIVAQWTAYIASVGGAIVLAYLLLAAWSSTEGSRGAGVVVAMLAGALLGGHLLAGQYRASLWNAGARVSARVVTQLLHEGPAIPSGGRGWVVNLPDNLGGAYVFRNAFPDAARVTGLAAPVDAILDLELRDRSADEVGIRLDSLIRDGRTIVWWYDGAGLRRWMGSPARPAP